MQLSLPVFEGHMSCIVCSPSLQLGFVWGEQKEGWGQSVTQLDKSSAGRPVAVISTGAAVHFTPCLLPQDFTLTPLPVVVSSHHPSVDLGERGGEAGLLPGHQRHSTGAPPLRGQL